MAALTISLAYAACVPGSGDEPQSRPNVLLIVTDDQRAEGTLDFMPTTRRWLARGGTVFSSAYTSTPLCCPSRASIMTGRYAHNHRVLTNQPNSTARMPHSTTLQRYLHDAGYSTAIAGKFLNGWPIAEDPPYFEDYWIFSAGNPYRRGTWNAGGDVRQPNIYSTTYIGDRAVDWLRAAEQDDGRPWFLFLSTAAPHQPSIAEARYSRSPIPPMEVNPAVTERDRADKPAFVRDERLPIEVARKIRREQMRSLASVDDMIERVSAELEDLEERDTLTIYTSDNGMLWGEHGLNGKTVPYEASIQVPLLVRWPRHLEAAAKDDRLVSNIDLAPTILDAAGVNARVEMDGMSLLGSGSRTSLLLEYWSMERYDTWDWAGLLERDRLYVEYSSPNERTYREYYDLDEDPWELHNLLGDTGAANDPNIRGLKASLDEARNCVGLTCP
jgi:arylsulfatase A-like enzyme